MWRYRLLVTTGLLLAVLLAAFAAVKISPGESPAVSLRAQKEYASYSTLFVTQSGFPWGRLAQGDDTADAANSGRLASLASLYSQLADSDQVADLNKQSLPASGWKTSAVTVLDVGSGTNLALPLVRIAGIANSPELARKTAAVAAASLQSYVTTRQKANDIARSDRVVLQLIKGPEEAELIHGRSYTQPIIIFLLLSMITLALPFIIDNIRRSLAAARAQDAADDLGRAEPTQGVAFDAADIEERRRVARLSQ